ncbi:plant/protein [Perilla frutescens var. frutescens]|nr:plant/protein [Perilla frutescens var. frutescens]
MVAEPWIVKMGNQVSNNLKHALYLENSTKSPNVKQGPQDRQTIGILSFEVANAMSKIIHLHKSLSENEISKLKNEILKSEGVRNLVCSDEKQLLELALEEKLDDLNKIAGVVSRLGKKCTIPALQGFEHVYGDIVSGAVDFRELSFLVKDMDGMVRKMERYVNYTATLYTEMEVMNELEVATKKFQQNQHEESRKAFEQKLTWQKQDVRHLKDVSLWNQTYDKVLELLARTVCTIFARLCIVFGDGFSENLHPTRWDSSLTKCTASKSNGYSHSHSGQVVNGRVEKKSPSLRGKLGIQRNEGGLLRAEDYNPACCIGRGRVLMECLSLSSSASKVDDDDDDDDHVIYDDESSRVSASFSATSGLKTEHLNLSGCLIHAISSGGDQRQAKGSLLNSSKFGHKSKLLAYAPPTTVGGSALALHYANVIIVLDKLLRYPHLVGDEARDDLYQMLPISLRVTLKSSLKSYVKDLAIYDAPLAHAWRERLDLMLKWLTPLAHNMIRWQSERNFEQQQIVTRKNVLLLQTLYFADREKTEAVVCELLVGLNYICRYEQQQNALLDCSSSFDFEDCMEWQLQVSGSFAS